MVCLSETFLKCFSAVPFARLKNCITGNENNCLLITSPDNLICLKATNFSGYLL